MKAFSRLSINQPVVKARVAALLAQADGVRWDVLFTRAAFYSGLIAGGTSLGVLLITLSGFVPGRAGVLMAAIGGAVGAVCTTCAALGPRMTQAAGISRQARDQHMPFNKVLPQIIAVFKDAPQIVRQAEADAQAQAREAEAERLKEQAQASHAALITDLAKEVTAIMERSSSFRNTSGGLVEDGVLAGPVAAEEVSPSEAAAPTVVEATQILEAAAAAV